MNVDFSNDHSQVSMQENAMQIPEEFEHAYPMPRPDLAGSSSFSSEHVGNLSSSDRLVMPKRPHNVSYFVTEMNKDIIRHRLNV